MYIFIYIYICFTTTLHIDGGVFLLCFNKGQIVRLGFCLKSLSLSITIKVQSNSLSGNIVQELCESRGGRPGLSVLTSLLVSVDVKIYCTVLRHWSQLVPNMSHDI